MKRVIFFLIFVFLFSTFSNSVSLSPPKDTLVLDHDFNGKIKFMVGQLANYDVIQFDFSAPFFKEKRKIVNVTGDTMFFTFDLNVPFDSISPGEHKYHIVIQPLGKNQGMAQAAVAYSLFIIKHFNIQYMTVGLDQKQYTKNDYSGIKFKVISLGNKTINNFDAILNIYDIDGNKLDTLKHEGFELNLYDEKPLIFDWDVNKRRPDIYKYDVSVFYGEDKNSFSKGDFKLGDVFVDVVNITNEFVTNIINEMDVEIDSRWNGDLTNVRANYILKKNGKTVSESNSPTIELKSWFKGNLKGFIDLKNVLNGKYNLTVDLKYVYKGVEKQTLKTFEVNVIDITESIAYKNANANGGYFYFGLIILILAIILFCYEFFGKKH
ncbi:hypothetical protein HOK68_04890, partial [Candidatus Woesearchaeota archaeon]|nr:hypothetical protein [Candidatus Woesearchaeota archaeon]